MTPTPSIYLSFNGQCEAAFRFYEQRLGGTTASLFAYGGSPAAADAPPGWDAKIMHGSMKIGDLTVMGADVAPDRYEQPKGFQVFLEVDDPAEAERLFDALATNATIVMPIQPTFWSVRFGVLTDQFGIPWSISCAQPPSA